MIHKIRLRKLYHTHEQGRSDYTANTTNAVCLENGVCDAWASDIWAKVIWANTPNAVCLENGVCDAWASDIWAKVIWANHLLPPPPPTSSHRPTPASLLAASPKHCFAPAAAAKRRLVATATGRPAITWPCGEIVHSLSVGLTPGRNSSIV